MFIQFGILSDNLEYFCLFMLEISLYDKEMLKYSPKIQSLSVILLSLQVFEP